MVIIRDFPPQTDLLCTWRRSFSLHRWQDPTWIQGEHLKFKSTEKRTELASKLYQVRPDLCATDCDIPPRDFLGKIWTDSLVHDDAALRLLVEVIGEDRVILGTDYPFPLGEVQIVDTWPGKVGPVFKQTSTEHQYQIMRCPIIHSHAPHCGRFLFWSINFNGQSTSSLN